jgi:hypothetical protein
MVIISALPMSDPLLRELDHYVVLEPGGGETILTASETLAWLATRLEGMEVPPADLVSLAGSAERARRLLETACELEVAPGLTVQWFAVRLEPPGRPGAPER